MKCPHCGVTVAAHGAEVLKCYSCGRWIRVLWLPGTRSTLGRFDGIKYTRPLKSWRGGWAVRPTQRELLVQLCRSHGFNIPFHGWKFERMYPGHWQRSAGAWSWRVTWEQGGFHECGSPDSVAACLKAGADADISS